MKKTKIWGIFCLFIGILSCKEEKQIEIPVPAETADIVFSNRVYCNGKEVKTNSIEYVNEAGQSFSVTRAEYFLSHFEFVFEDGSSLLFDTALYCNGIKMGSFKLKGFPLKKISQVNVLVGLDSMRNKTGALPKTAENINMGWPDPIGGGYHFLKFEGKFLDSLGKSNGFTLHLGKNENLVKATFKPDLKLNSGLNNLNLIMDLDEWFKNPLIYDLEIDGSSSMFSAPNMAKLSKNGTDVLRIRP